MEVLQLRVRALELGAAQAKLISFCGATHAFRGATLLEVAFAEQSQGDIESRLQQAIDVLAIDAVNGLPFDIDEARIANHNVVVRQFQIDGHLLGEVAGHCRLCVLS